MSPPNRNGAANGARNGHGGSPEGGVVLVAGAAGFIGSHLAEALLDRGHRVLGVDDLSTGRSGNLDTLRERDGFELIQQDVCNPVHVEEPLAAVMDLASPASPQDYLEDPVGTMRVGSQGTENLLELALDHDALFLLTSTSEVYGDPQVNPQPETYWGHVNPVGPRSVYDEAKRYAEALTQAYHRTYDLDVRVARIFNTYGPRMRPDDGRVIPTFLRQALRGEPLTVYGDGTQTRSFCYIDDMVRGILALVNRGDHEPTNLGNTRELTIIDLARQVQELVPHDVRIVHEELPQDDPTLRCPDITRARRTLGWEPEVPLEEGLERTLEHFRAHEGIAMAEAGVITS